MRRLFLYGLSFFLLSYVQSDVVMVLVRSSGVNRLWAVEFCSAGSDVRRVHAQSSNKKPGRGRMGVARDFGVAVGRKEN